MRAGVDIVAGVIAVAAFASATTYAAEKPRAMTRAEFLFRAAQPCPVTGKTHGACPGYVVDRLIPVVCGGVDAPSNMRWLTMAEARAKAKWDRIGCRAGRKYVYPWEAPPAVTEAHAAELPPDAMEVKPLPP
jgi:hypothetical protein